MIMISALILIVIAALICEHSTAFAPTQLSNRIIQSTQLHLDFFNFGGKQDEPKDTTTTGEETEEDTAGNFVTKQCSMMVN